MAKKKVDLDKRLAKAFKQHLTGAKEGAKSSGFDEYDDGRYKARLIKAELGESSNGRLQVAMSWKFLSGEYKKKIKIAYQGVETEDNLKFMFRDLNKLGYDTDELEGPDDLIGILKELNKEKPEAKIALKTKGDFQNVNIVAVKGSDDDEDAEDEDGEDDDADDSDDDDDDDKKKSKSKKSKKKDDDDDDDDDDDSDDDDSDDEDEDDDKKKKSKSKKKKSDDDDDDDDADDDDDSDDEDDDEDDKKKSKKKSKKKDDDDEDDDDSDDDDDASEDVELSVGSEVTYKYKGKKLKGTVLDIFPKDNEVRVETDDKKRRVSFDDIVEVEVPEKPKGKKKSKK